MEIMEDTSCAFPGSSLLMCLALRFIQPLLPYTGSHGLCRPMEEYLSCLRSLSEDTAFVSFPSSMAHSHDTPPAPAQAQNFGS